MFARRRHCSIGAAVVAVVGLWFAGTSTAATSTTTGTIVAVHRGDFIIWSSGSKGGKLNEMVSYADSVKNVGGKPLTGATP